MRLVRIVRITARAAAKGQLLPRGQLILDQASHQDDLISTQNICDEEKALRE